MKHKSSHRILLVLASLELLAATTITVFAAGANTPFKTYEAEAGTLGGGAAVVAMTSVPAAPTPESEASGRKFVELNATGESVTWTNTATANAIVVRACLPDSAGGGGITNTLNLYVNGVFRQAITLTSTYTWVYGTSGYDDNNPASGTPKRFFDDFRTFITGAAVASGSTITLQKDAANSASFYYVDCIDLENVGSALTQPANTLSITDYGATANDTTDDNAAILSCLAACKAQGKNMWIPAGTFVSAPYTKLDKVTIYGAGMWYTTIYHPAGQNYGWQLKDANIQDLYIDSNSTHRTISTGGSGYGLLTIGTNGWFIDRVWVHNCNAQWLSGTNGSIRNCRVGSSWADGINLGNGPITDPTLSGQSLTSSNNFIRGAGDDGIALNAQNGTGTTNNMNNTKIINNTTIGVYAANGLRIAGGKNTILQGNLVTDSAAQNAIRVGQYGGYGNPCESILVTNNTVLRSGGITTTYGGAGITIADGAVATVINNTVTDAFRDGIEIFSSTASFTGNTVNNPMTQGFWIRSGSSGAGTFTNNTVTAIHSGQNAFQNDASGTFSTTLVGNSWQTPPAPTGLSATAVSSSQINLSWTGAIGATSYNVKRSTTSGGPYTTNALGVTGTSYSDVGLSEGTTYYYVVSAVSAGGLESTNSTQVSATTLLVIPILLSQGQPVTASSSATGGDAAYGNDGILTNRWSANGPVYPSWWRVDLGTNYNLSSVVINWYNALYRSYQYKIEVSTDDTNYVTVVDETDNTLQDNTTNTFSAVARYVRVTVTGCSQYGGYPSFYECQVFGSVVSPVSLTPTNILMTASGSTLALSWPADHLGWHLQVQTNDPVEGLTTNWFTVPGSDHITSTNIPINPANGGEFYRLIYP